ncbi:hypothetical protein EN836_30820 [Mesorhizobium sp. M1C.F.Ca.ET.193.01.1.1]|uniref:hypothetical protein n=1 Tax=unclassified Mesorhizobium TaxID=325217 RepID=UPI000FD3421E|nr:MULTISPECIES: hypothetical protein [unclassified Mesorhizobium]TGS91958.1 hypothetical protein EN820_51480 [bacterium M00.F.Ca.ET.177.01.1.1]TGQ50046.1 hypothetical protein EN853_30810 [Mesorhizobium sp. M1C.F.Ca.ET.210.01.1.1]TGQ64740.1 hypothetical protein EN855_030825 [Mesorhizobium sp. M1C.F.Ca.ET.212.01.1.1]TGQ98356.1 hypothetical protein EN847_30810 [Mesorhizobium sp. M1C.F.Ca.ET.204.01.1.1]TGR18661.1 hypothetical protein EN839_30810 [Mesorhizobium sp. M1C.F.Ca.ET.196.01.1.1]
MDHAPAGDFCRQVICDLGGLNQIEEIDLFAHVAVMQSRRAGRRHVPSPDGEGDEAIDNIILLTPCRRSDQALCFANRSC